MKKNIKALYKLPLLTVVFVPYVWAAPIVVPDPPDIAAKGYVLMDFHSGKVLAKKNEEQRLNPASLTKIMTSYVVGQEIERGNISLDDEVVVSEKAWAKNFPNSSKMFIEVGDTVKVADLNRGVIIQSGNDASVAIAEHIAGSEESFVALMNGWAEAIGMKNTHFANSHGLDDKDLYSTPYDLAILSRALIKDLPAEYKIYKEKSFKYDGINQLNRNSLLWDASMNVDGIKTGHTKAAGYNLVSSATEDDMRLIAVVMGTKSKQARQTESKELLNYGFRFFETVNPHDANETFVTERVWMGEVDQAPLGVAQDTYVTIPRGKAKELQASFVLEKNLEAPINKGDVVGKLYYKIGDTIEAEYPLVVLKDVHQGGFFSRIADRILLWLRELF